MPPETNKNIQIEAVEWLKAHKGKKPIKQKDVDDDDQPNEQALEKKTLGKQVDNKKNRKNPKVDFLK